jgi:hypothetical protein
LSSLKVGVKKVRWLNSCRPPKRGALALGDLRAAVDWPAASHRAERPKPHFCSDNPSAVDGVDGRGAAEVKKSPGR